MYLALGPDVSIKPLPPPCGLIIIQGHAVNCIKVIQPFLLLVHILRTAVVSYGAQVHLSLAIVVMKSQKLRNSED